MIAQRHGDAKFKRWRRSYATRPPEVSSFSSHYPGNDDRYVKYAEDMRVSVRETLIRSLSDMRLKIHRKFPKAESLKDCMSRTIPFYTDQIVPQSVAKDKTVLIASSENAIRGLFMHLCDIPPDRISEVEIPTGLPLVYNIRKRCIQLLETGLEDPNDPLGHLDFGSAPELLFQPCDSENDEECFLGADGRSYRYDPLIRLGEEERKAVEEEIMLAAREAEKAAAAAVVRSPAPAAVGV
jgi:2,3-bisphosphoglycerate-dependent phosphoglycerate mutase